jgi:quercetin dioxygenase-like cupin family protein
MAATTEPGPVPIALRKDEGEALWFLDGLVILKATGATTGGQLAVIEQLAPAGAGSPLHVHEREDEAFYVLDGEMTFWVGGQVTKATAGAFVYGPRGIPHTFTVTSPTARFLLMAQPAGFESFVKALSEPAKTRTLPTASAPDVERLARVAAEYGIRILGPPGIPT